MINVLMLQSGLEQVNQYILRFSLASNLGVAVISHEIYHKRFAGIIGESRMCRHKEIGLEAMYMRSDAVSLHRHTKHT